MTSIIYIYLSNPSGISTPSVPYAGKSIPDAHDITGSNLRQQKYKSNFAGISPLIQVQVYPIVKHLACHRTNLCQQQSTLRHG